MLINAADQWVDVSQREQGKHVNFIAEGGSLELFVFQTARGPKLISKKLSLITGFQRLPPWWSLGFHYSKWEKTSADRVRQYDTAFETNGFALDVLWMDIEYSDDVKYFIFNPITFSKSGLDTLKDQISDHKRHLVVITDPHIKNNGNYFVREDGLKLE